MHNIIDAYLKRENERRWVITGLSSITRDTHITAYEALLCDMFHDFPRDSFYHHWKSCNQNCEDHKYVGSWVWIDKKQRSTSMLLEHVNKQTQKVDPAFCVLDVCSTQVRSKVFEMGKWYSKLFENQATGKWNLLYFLSWARNTNVSTTKKNMKT